MAVHACDVLRLDVQRVGARAGAHEPLAEHLRLLVVVVGVRAAAAGARGGRRGAAPAVGALDLVLLVGAARHHPPHLRRLRLPQPHPAAAAAAAGAAAAAASGLHLGRRGRRRWPARGCGVRTGSVKRRRTAEGEDRSGGEEDAGEWRVIETESAVAGDSCRLRLFPSSFFTPHFSALNTVNLCFYFLPLLLKNTPSVLSFLFSIF